MSTVKANTIAPASGGTVTITGAALTTPALGTPASGTLTNCVGLPASAVVNTPAGGISATTVQAALNELDSEKFDKSGGTMTDNLAFANGKGIDFSATPGSGTSELLNDYEEGSFTPLLSCSTSNPTVTYGLQRCEYVKIGKFVQCSVFLSWSDISGGTGNIRVNLPFEIDPSVGTSPGGVITRMRGLTIPSSRVWSQVEGIHGTNLVQITGMLTGSSTVILDASAFTAQIGEICFNICYRASA